MPAERDPHITDAFVVATFALWAGDFDYCQRLFKETASTGEFGKVPDSVEGPVELVQYIAALRQRQLSKKKAEYKEITIDYRLAGYEQSGEPAILETPHLRGVIWRLAARQFQMLAYLSDLSWERHFFDRVKLHVSKFGEEKPPPPPPRGVKSTGPLEMYAGRGGSWVSRGSLFIQVTVSDLGHIEADGTWTDTYLPKEASQIQEGFLGVLRSLDGAVQT